MTFTIMTLTVLLFILTLYGSQSTNYDDISGLDFKKQPVEGGRCGICPTYFQKVCAFDFGSNFTYIFDNSCIMDLYNCIHGSDFVKLKYESCLYFSNFAYVHGLKREDYDYLEDHISITNAKKNPDFAY